MGDRTPLHAAHLAAGAKMVDFGGWDMPIHYGSQIEEHHAVRRSAGMFDVSHMTVVDITGEGATDFLRELLANDVAKLKTTGKALYSCMLDEDGGIIDDLITYQRGDAGYRMVVNASTREKDLLWIRSRFLDSDADHGHIVIHGHTPEDEPVHLPNRIGIDTGATSNGVLTAVGLHDNASPLFLRAS